MVEQIPNDVIEFTRGIFAQPNLRATTTLARQPAAHEVMLDFQLIAALDEVGPCLLGSGVAIDIETHWIGGRRHYNGREVADIVILVVLRRGDRLLWRKVALLQSKRLWPREIPGVQMELNDIGIIRRLVDQNEGIPTRTNARRFHFTNECVYKEMAESSIQVEVIEEYVNKYNIPVFYSFYNPPTMPFQGTIPRLVSGNQAFADNQLGCRVLTSQDVHAALWRLSFSREPRFIEMTRQASATTVADPYDNHGWRLETFVADEVMRCREGRLFERADDPDLYVLLYERPFPISSLVQISIDLPG
jgi:hypothetical protein